MPAGRYWTTRDIETLRAVRRRATAAAIAARLNRTEYAVKAQARRMRIRKFDNPERRQ